MSFTGRRFLVAVALLTGAIAPLGACNRDRGESIKLVNEGILSERNGGHQMAYAKYWRAASIDPANHRALSLMGIIELYDRKEAQKGVEHLLAAEKLAPNDRDILFHLGRFYANTKPVDPAKALGFLGRAIQTDPNFAPAHYQKGVALLAKGDLAAADAAFREALACDATYTPAYLDLAGTYEALELPELAVEVYEKALLNADQKSDLLNSLAILRMDQGKVKDALELFQKAYQAEPNRTDILFNLAFAFVANQDAEQAANYLAAFINQADSKKGEQIKVAELLRKAMLLEQKRKLNEAPPMEPPPKPDAPKPDAPK